ncbi:metal ABC transporter ATP-binding protein [Microbacterium sp. ZW T5_56]|uniref:metal ABC transporter ATP-binding protein n=1 Tax=Microbacterium sp. ZW T5_56 TaxID=3378081 RepID=UPI003852C926
MTLPNRTPSLDLPLDAAVSLDRVTFAYDRADTLRDATLDVLPGTVTVLRGPNGSGKSTLLEILAGVRRPRCGTVRRSGSVALVVQRIDELVGLPVTVDEVVRMGTWRAGTRIRRSHARGAIGAALTQVGLEGCERQPFASLSGGQRQRTLLAQALVQRPDVLLLDEPDAGLDSESTEHLSRLLAAEAARGAAVVCISHDSSVIAAADRVVELSAGRIVSDSGH